MPKIIPPGYADCTLIWTQSGDNEPYYSTIGVRLLPGMSDPSIVAASIQADWLGAWPAGSLSNTYTFVGARATLGQDGPDPGPTGEAIVNVAGTSSSAHLPSNCAVLSRKLTLLGGRRNRGRMFLPAGYLSEGNVDQNGNIAGATLTSMRAQQSAFLTAIETDGTRYDAAVIFHSAAPSTPTVVSDLTIEAKIATQRRRMRK